MMHGGRHASPEHVAAATAWPTVGTGKPRHAAPEQPGQVTAALSRAAAFREELHNWLSRLRDVALETPGPVPPELSRPEVPGYFVDEDEFVYCSTGSDGQLYVRRAADEDELLFWIVDDLACILAQRWAIRAPAYRPESAVARDLFYGRWHNLMAALSTEWGERTLARIDYLESASTNGAGGS